LAVLLENMPDGGLQFPSWISFNNFITTFIVIDKRLPKHD